MERFVGFVLILVVEHLFVVFIFLLGFVLLASNLLLQQVFTETTIQMTETIQKVKSIQLKFHLIVN